MRARLHTTATTTFPHPPPPLIERPLRQGSTFWGAETFVAGMRDFRTFGMRDFCTFGIAADFCIFGMLDFCTFGTVRDFCTFGMRDFCTFGMHDFCTFGHRGGIFAHSACGIFAHSAPRPARESFLPFWANLDHTTGSEFHRYSLSRFRFEIFALAAFLANMIEIGAHCIAPCCHPHVL